MSVCVELSKLRFGPIVFLILICLIIEMFIHHISKHVEPVQPAAFYRAYWENLCGAF
jgi:hypothetical protein